MSQTDTIIPIIDAIAYFNKFRGNTFLIKLGGSILHNEQLIETLCFDLKLLKESGINIVIVHGGSKAINQHLANNQIESEFIDGLRVTSFEAMQIIEMVLCGHINKILVRKLNNIGIKTIGLSGTDNNMLLCNHHSNKHGYVGVINSVNPETIATLISRQTNSEDPIPIISPVGVNAQGDPMNINADHAAAHIASALKVNKLIYLTDQEGVYDKDGVRLSQLSEDDLVTLIENETVKGGMLTKTNAILLALDKGLDHIHILNGNRQHVLLEELFTVEGVGTLCKNKLTEKIA